MFVHRAAESSFVELLSDFRRAAESSLVELLSDFRRAAVGSVLSSSCCRSVIWSSCCSGQETVEIMSLLSDAGVNNRAKKPWKRCRKQSRELFLEVRWPRPFTERDRISLNYCAAYFFRKDGVCVVLAYFFPGRVRRLFLPGTLQVRSKHVNDTVRYGNFFLTPTVHVPYCYLISLLAVVGMISVIYLYREKSLFTMI